MLEEILQHGLAEMGLPHDGALLSRFRTYYEYLYQQNLVMNLTAITGEDEVARLHFLDSAAPLRSHDMGGASVIDIGSGAGFPGVVLKLLCPSLRLTLLDSQQKRVLFLQSLCRRLGMDDVECVHARAEETGPRRESYDFAVSRAVARMNLLSELCLPYVRPGGSFIALKGPAAAEELAEAKRAIAALGGGTPLVREAGLEEGGLRHTIVTVPKASATPARYPRPYAQMKKNPL